MTPSVLYPHAMNQELWTKVDTYITDSLHPHDAVLDNALQNSEAAGLPTIAVAPTQGKFLHLLARMQRAKRILEIGTLGGYSTIWLARALPADGKLITLEFDPKHFKVASANIAMAGLNSIVELKLGPAADSLAKLHAEGADPFDLIFIDADKPNNPTYLAWALRLSRPGTVIIGDNVVRDGSVINAADPDPSVQGTRQFFDLLASEPSLDATALQTVGSKGYDGFALAIVR
jgi:predicted O-methyltransferase YrrM